MSYRNTLQATQAEFSAAFLLWGQYQCHPNTDLGGTYRQSVVHSHCKNDKKACLVLTDSDYAETDSDVLY